MTTTRCGVPSVRPGFEVGLTTGETVRCDRLLIATGGGKVGGGLELARGLGHTIEPPVPSLFTFQITDPRLAGLAGVAVENAEVRVAGTRLAEGDSVDPITFVRIIAAARIIMPRSFVRLAAGREDMSDETHALCFLAGVNSIFYGAKLLTTPNAAVSRDAALLERLGMAPMRL